MKAKLLVALLCLTSLVVFPGLASAQLGSISGRVTDEVTGYPIMGAHVWARGDTTEPGGFGFDFTDSLGFYMIDSLHAGVFLVSASASGYQMEHYPDSVMVIAGQNTPDVDFALTPVGEETGSISGIIADEVTGLRIASAHVWAYGDSGTPGGGEAWSDTDGYYLIHHLAAGQYIVAVHKAGYVDETYPDSVIVVAGENTPDIDFALTPIGGPEFGSISGRVTDEQTGHPIIMAEITIVGIYCVWYTDTAGYYFCDSLPPGAYIVNAHKEGYIPETYPDSVIVLAGENSSGIDFALTPTGEYGSISGRVTDEETGLPIIMAHLVAIGVDNWCYGEAWSDTGGYYMIPNLCAGIYQVNANKPGYVPETFPDSVGVIAGENTPHIDFALIPIGGEAGSISGRVTDEVTGITLPMAHVLAYDSTFCAGDAWTDTAGYYLIQNLPARQYMVAAHKAGYMDEVYPESVTVEEGQNTPNIDFALTPVGGEFGSISGRVTDEVTGYPIVGAAITVSGIYCVWYTDSTGYYLCDGIPPGSYLVNAHKEGYIPETYPDSVIVLAGENSSGIDFALTPTGEYGSISGRVTDEETGLPIIMAHLVAIGVDNWCYGEAWSDTGGYYMIPNLCAGIYQVNANKPGYVPETFPDSVGVIAGENTPHIDFALIPIGGEAGSISGRVTDEVTGIPLPMAHVLAYDSTFCAGDAWTDTAGYYLIQNLPARQYMVAVHKDGYVDEVYPESVTVEEGQNTPDIDFALTPVGGETGSISGRVTDEVTGLPLPMAHVWAHRDTCPPCGGEAWTDTAGYYLIQNLSPGQYEMGVHKDGYQDEVYPGLVTVVEGQNTPNIDFALTPTGEYGSISGRVTDEETGLPIITAHLVAVGLDNWCYGEAWSDTGGYYMIPNLCAGIYQVNANKPGYVPETYPDSVVVVGGENTPDIDFALFPMGEPGSISGTITDSVTEESIPYAQVCAYGEFGHGQAWTDSLGQYTILGLCPGCYFVTAWAWGYLPQDYPDTVCVMEGQNTAGIDFALVPHGGPGEGVIAGQVFEDTTFLLPIPFAIVFAISLDGNWGFDFTDSVGAYMIQGLQTDDYYLYAFAPGYIGEFYDGAYTWEEATLVVPDAYDIDFYLAPCGPGGGRISGVINSEGSSVEGAFVYAQASGEVKGFARSSTEGGYVINGLLPGTYTVSASKVWYHDGSYPDPIEIGSGKASEIDIELPPIQVGDVTGDGTIDIGDVVFIINYLYISGLAPDPLMTGDVNCDGVVNIADVIYIINYLYINGPSPCYP